MDVLRLPVIYGFRGGVNNSLGGRRGWVFKLCFVWGGGIVMVKEFAKFLQHQALDEEIVDYAWLYDQIPTLTLYWLKQRRLCSIYVGVCLLDF